ncbi:phage holin family protein [Aeromicrobium sp.]|uniref:phage holin family protein n=1 Tax=Aeromicrobium sp. TaxID=1871063 RepID=UPI0028B0D57E|nr:phage holin family protein [Aeromicrobium sp.]
MSQTSSGEPSTGELISRLSTDLSTLVRDELRLATVEMSGKAKKAGMGAGMFGAAGVLALYGGGVLLAAIVAALDLAMPLWLAALIVAVVLFIAAGIAALMGKNKVSEVGSPMPEKTVESVKADVDAVKHARDH